MIDNNTSCLKFNDGHINNTQKTELSQIINKAKNLVSDNKEYVFLSVYLLTILFFISSDSYTHHKFYHWDSAVFFTSGKAWVNGMIPYVDYADSKGPFLWFINGIGYIISPHDYTGIFWLSWFSFTIFFFFLYKISLLYLKNKSLAILSVVMITPFVFLLQHKYEMKGENWCQPFIAATVYYACRVIHFGKVSTWDIRKASIVFGVSFSVCLLVKYNIAVMLSSVFLCLFYFLWRNNYRVLPVVMWSFTGAVLMALPFIIWLMSLGAFDAFINEYFINTLLTITNSPRSGGYLSDLVSACTNTFIVSYFILLLTGCIYISVLLKFKSRWFLPFVLIFIYAVCLRHHIHYYFMTCTPLLIFFILSGVFLCRRYILKAYHTLFPLATVCICLFTVVVGNIDRQFKDGIRIDKSIWFVDSELCGGYEKVYSILSKINKPKIIFYNCIDTGEGIQSDALPGSVYWTSQCGATEAMVNKQKSDIQSGRADFLVTVGDEKDSAACLAFLNSCGYVEILRYKDGFSEAQRVLMKRSE